MPKINIPGLTSFPDGRGFGSSIVAPDFPEAASIHGINFYGTAYSEVADSGNVRYVSSLSGLPSGITLGTTGLIAEGNPASPVSTLLTGIREPWDGTFMVLFTLSGVTAGTANIGTILDSDKRLKIDARWRNNTPGAASTTEPPFTDIQGVSGFITKGDPNSAQLWNTETTLSSNVIKIDSGGNDMCMIALTKDISANELRLQFHQGDTALLEQIAVTFGTEDKAASVEFGAKDANMPGPNTLHAVGSWDTPLTTVQVVDMWQALQHTLASA